MEKKSPVAPKEQKDVAGKAKMKAEKASSMPAFLLFIFHMLGANQDSVYCDPPRATRNKGTCENRQTVMDLLEQSHPSISPTPSAYDDEYACYSVINQFLKTLSDEQWMAIRRCMHKHKSKEKISKACHKIVKVISMTVFRLLVPAIIEVLKQEDLDVSGSDSSSWASLGLEDLNRDNACVVRKGTGGEQFTKPASAATSGRSSQGSILQTEIDDPLRSFFGVTEDTILQSLMATSTSPAPELTRVLVGEVVEQLNTSISATVSHTSLRRSSPVIGCNKMVEKAIKQMGRGIHVGLQRICLCKKLEDQNETSTSEKTPKDARKDMNSLLAPITSEVVMAMVDTLERSHNMQGNGQGAMEVLRVIAQNMSNLDAQSSHMDDLAKMTAPMGSDSSIHVEVLSCPEFQRSASRAVSEVLRKQTVTPSPRLSRSASAAASLMDVCDSVAPSSSSLSLAKAQSAASVLIQIFVTDIEDVAACMQLDRGVAPAPESIRRHIFSEAQRIFVSMQARLKSLFMLPSRTGSGQLPLSNEELEPCTKEVMKLVLSASRSDDAVVGCSPLKASPAGCSPQSLFMEQLMRQLENLTISSSCAKVQPESSSDQAGSSTTSDLHNVRKLSRESILHKAKDGVTEVLLRNSESFKSVALSSFTPPSPTSNNSFRSQADIHPSENQNDDEASEIIKSFVSGVKDIVQAVEAGDCQRQADVEQPLNTDRDVTGSSHSDYPSRRPNTTESIFSATLNLYRSLRGKLSEYVTRKSGKETPNMLQGDQPGTRIESTHSGLRERTNSISEALNDEQSGQTQLDDTTKEVITEILISHMTHMEKLRSCPSRMSAVTEDSLAAGPFVKDILTQLDGFTSSPTRDMTVPFTSKKCPVPRQKVLEEMSFSLPGTPTTNEIPFIIRPIIRNTIIDATTDRKPAVIPRVSDVVSTILGHVESASLGDNATKALKRLEQLILEGRISDLSRDLVDQLLGVMRDDRDALLKQTAPTERSVFDTMLSGLCQTTREQTGKFFMSELIYSFAEESIKQLLLPLLLSPGSSQDVTLSPHVSRCPSTASPSRSSVESDSSMLCNDTVSLFTKVMVHQVVSCLSLPSESSVGQHQDADRKSSAKSSTSLSLADSVHTDEISDPSDRQCKEDSPKEEQFRKKAKRRFHLSSSLSKLRLRLKRSKNNQTIEVQSTEAAVDHAKMSSEEQPCTSLCSVSLPAVEVQPEKAPRGDRPFLVRVFSAMNKGLRNTFRTTSKKTQTQQQ